VVIYTRMTFVYRCDEAVPEEYLAMAVQLFFGPWPLFQFLNLYTVGRTPWTGDEPVARPLPTHRTT
jgi:hypothetical protein